MPGVIAVISPKIRNNYGGGPTIVEVRVEREGGDPAIIKQDTGEAGYKT